ncbi:MAG TPA: sensor histidine kinase, partial [Acidimicrobiales bacterium]|nr:sensor histidine kinase [Acidimicrobiales bacterium]
VVGVVAERGETRSLSLIVAWCIFCAASNVLPVPAVRNVYLSMSSPVNVAIAYLFPPGIVAAIVFGASISEWEIRRQTTPLHALFNRAQLASAAALASFVFTGHRDEVPHAGILVAAVTLYQASNWLFVAMAEWTARGVPLRRVLRGLVPSGVAATATYLALGLMGVVLALTSLEIGVWAVALLMLPLLGARHAVTVSRQLEQAERERRALGDRLIDERERERTRIASDIHDVVLQQLAALQIQADSIGAALDHGRPEVAVRLASQLRRGIDDTIVELRHTIASLRRVAITEGGLVPSLERFARTFRTSAGLDVELSASGVDDDLPLPVALLLFECCQEALTNVARHAGADKVLVGVTRTGDAVELRVADDGQGFDPSATGANRSGLVLTREKVTLAGGMHIVDSRPGTGTTVTVRVPLGSRG